MGLVPVLHWPAARDPTKPTHLDALCGTPIAAEALGEGHSLVLTRDGRLFAFGENCEGQLGLGRTSSELNVSKPTELPSPVAALAHVQVLACPTHYQFLLTHLTSFT